jgi:hypothetical protein
MDVGTAFLLIIVLVVVVGGGLFVAFGGALGGRRSERESLLRQRPEHTAVDLEQSRRGEQGVPTDDPSTQR